MTEPSQPRPVPGPPRPSAVVDGNRTAVPADPAAPADRTGAPADRFADLEQRPVADHVAVFEDEHGRLQRELGTIDQL